MDLFVSMHELYAERDRLLINECDSKCLSRACAVHHFTSLLNHLYSACMFIPCLISEMVCNLIDVTCLVTGKWFNYGIIFLVLILDLNMWKNQIFYKPYEYGQYVGPGEKIYTVEEPETLGDFNHSTLTYEWRSTNADPNTNLSYVERDMFLHSRYVGASLDVKCLAFIPSLAAFVLFGFFIWLFGRFQDSETFTENQDNTYERIKRKSPSEYSKEMGVTPEEMHVTIGDGLKRSAMFLSVDGPHFGATPSTNSTISVETQETHPSIVIDSTAQDEPAVSFDVHKLSP